ncbi:MAG: hypothetical protein VW712_15645, partial [Paracoccaceae bacterium]
YICLELCVELTSCLILIKSNFVLSQNTNIAFIVNPAHSDTLKGYQKGSLYYEQLKSCVLRLEKY